MTDSAPHYVREIVLREGMGAERLREFIAFAIHAIRGAKRRADGFKFISELMKLRGDLDQIAANQAQQSLGRELSHPETAVIKDAFNVGTGAMKGKWIYDATISATLGYYSQDMLLEKVEILKTGGFSKEDMKKLQEDGVIQLTTAVEDKIPFTLWKTLTQDQLKAIEDAHFVGLGEDGENGASASTDNYTKAQLREKIRILKQAGFSKADRRNLMEDGIVGLGSPLNQMAIQAPEKQHLKTTQQYLRTLTSSKKILRYFKSLEERGAMGNLDLSGMGNLDLSGNGSYLKYSPYKF